MAEKERNNVQLGGLEWEVIHEYSRAEAIADGVLIDATALAKEAGFVYPVALTSAAYHDCVRVPPEVSGQDETGRLWDILMVLRHKIKMSRTQQSPLFFTFLVKNDNSNRLQAASLKGVCGPGDDGEPVLTIMLPHED